MPTRKYRVDTDKGSFMVEVEEPTPTSGFANRLDPSIKQSGDDSPVGQSPSLMDNLVNNPMIKGAAHPQTLGDVLSLVLPSGVPAVGEFLGRGWQAVKGAAQETTGISRLPTLPFRAIGKFNEALPSNMAREAAGSPNVVTAVKPTPAPGPINYDTMKAPGWEAPPADRFHEFKIDGIPPRRPTVTPPPEPVGVSPSSLGEGAPVPSPTENASSSSALQDVAPPQAAGTRPPQMPINEVVRPSRSSAGAGPDGLTDADRKAAGINPAMRITKAPQSTADLINSARGARRRGYIVDAEQDAVRQSSMDRDPQGPVDLTAEQLQELLRQMGNP